MRYRSHAYINDEWRPNVRDATRWCVLYFVADGLADAEAELDAVAEADADAPAVADAEAEALLDALADGLDEALGDAAFGL